MESNLVRVPEPAIMIPDEEMDYIKCNSVVFQDGHPLLKPFFKDFCPGLPSARNLRILDAGCGMAAIAVHIAMELPEAYVVAVDASVVMLRYAKVFVNHLKLGDRVSVRCAWLPDAGFGEPDQSFDLVFARSTLHHFMDPKDFWKIVKRYAKKDAAVFVIDLLRPPDIARLNELVRQRCGDQTSPIRSAFQASLLAAHTLGEIGHQLIDAGLYDIVLKPFPEGTHMTATRVGRFGKRIL